MQTKVTVGSVTEIASPLLVVNLFEGVVQPTGATGAIDAALGGLISRLIAQNEVTGKLNEVALFHTLGRIPAERVAVVGLGKKEEFTAEKARQAAGSVARRAQQLKLDRFATIAHGGQAGLSPFVAGQAVVEGTLLGTYRYLRFKTEGNEGKQPIAELTIIEHDQAKVPRLQEGAAKGQIIAEATILARDLSNGPGNLVTPTYMAEQAGQVAERYGLDYTALAPEEMRHLGMGALLGVAQGSAQEPRLIFLRYRAGGEQAKTLGFVGKGITFDSGGISIKPGNKMEEMKHDMSGGAAVIGAAMAIAALKLPVNVLAVVPATENMPSGSAYKPGDILTAMNGKTIEVVNTDAEGRIALADGLAYAVREGADVLVDLATLTGGVVTALGHVATGAVGNDQRLCQALLRAGEESGERLWQLPAWDEYKELIKSDIADVKNSGDRGASTISGGLFLANFVGGKPWCHLDIAGTAWLDSDRPYSPKGATGVGVRLLTQFCEEWAQNPAL